MFSIEATTGWRSFFLICGLGGSFDEEASPRLLTDPTELPLRRVVGGELEMFELMVGLPETGEGEGFTTIEGLGEGWLDSAHWKETETAPCKRTNQ